MNSIINECLLDAQTEGCSGELRQKTTDQPYRNPKDTLWGKVFIIKTISIFIPSSNKIYLSLTYMKQCNHCWSSCTDRGIMQNIFIKIFTSKTVLFMKNYVASFHLELSWFKKNQIYDVKRKQRPGYLANFCSNCSSDSNSMDSYSEVLVVWLNNNILIVEWFKRYLE